MDDALETQKFERASHPRARLSSIKIRYKCWMTILYLLLHYAGGANYLKQMEVSRLPDAVDVD